MKFSPEERFQSPTQMLEALDGAASALDSGVDVEQEEKLMTAAMQDRVEKEKKQTSVMIVEANSNLQDVFREFFKKAGYRVLVVSNCDRALERLDDGEAFNVDAALFNAQNLGKNAVLAFNKLLDAPTTKDLPAVLILDENQVKWAPAAKRGKKRLAVGMPISMKRLLMVVDKLTKDEVAAKEEKAKLKAAAAAGSSFELLKPTAPQPKPKPEQKQEAPQSAEEEFPEDAYDAALDSAFETFSLKSKEKDAENSQEKSVEEQAAESDYDDTDIEDDYEDEDDEE
jgi:CheY-like chemotaxis protein